MLIPRSVSDSGEFLATTLRSVGDGVMTVDLDSCVTFLNPMAELLTGWSSDEAVGRESSEIFSIFDPDQEAPIKCPALRVLESGKATGYTNHTVIRAKDGTERTISYNGAPLTGTDGQIHGVVVVFHVAVNHVQRELSEERHRLIERATNDAVWDWDIASGRMWVNDGVTSLFGYQPDDVADSHEWWLDHIHPQDRDRVFQNLQDSLKDRRYWQDEYRFQCKDGSYSHVLERGYVLRDPLGEAVRLVSAVMDVTSRRQAQEELLRLNEELERRVEERTLELRQANQELESFSYSVSHDLRSPLRTVIGLSRALEHDNADHLTDESRQMLTRLVKSASRMGDLIEDMLQYSRLSRAQLHKVEVDLSELADEVSADLEHRWQGCHQKISIQPAMRCEADPALLRVLLENLLDNACKFSSNKSDAQIEFGEDLLDGERIFYVRDNGAGFDPRFGDKLFSPFTRLHSDSEFPGTGIGLANVARIVRRHGGKIWAEGRPGEGATFRFTLQGSLPPAR